MERSTVVGLHVAGQAENLGPHDCLQPGRQTRYLAGLLHWCHLFRTIKELRKPTGLAGQAIVTPAGESSIGVYGSQVQDQAGFLVAKGFCLGGSLAGQLLSLLLFVGPIGNVITAWD